MHPVKMFFEKSDIFTYFAAVFEINP